MAGRPVQYAWNHEALISPWMGGADAFRLLRRRFSEDTMNRDIPADASGAYWPGPPAKTESLPGLVPPIFLS